MANMFLTFNENTDPFSHTSFTSFFNKLYPSLCRYCLSLVRDREIAEDIVQDQFLYLWENRSRLNDVISMESYIFRAVKNRSINYLQRNIQTLQSLTIGEDVPNDKFTLSIDPSLLAESKELENIIEKALASLPRKCHAVFSLKRFGGLSNKEIAKELNISIKTVEAQMSIAIKKMFDFISSHWTSLAFFPSTLYFFSKIYSF